MGGEPRRVRSRTISWRESRPTSKSPPRGTKINRRRSAHPLGNDAAIEGCDRAVAAARYVRTTTAHAERIRRRGPAIRSNASNKLPFAVEVRLVRRSYLVKRAGARLRDARSNPPLRRDLAAGWLHEPRYDLQSRSRRKPKSEPSGVHKSGGKISCSCPIRRQESPRPRSSGWRRGLVESSSKARCRAQKRVACVWSSGTR